MSVRGLQIKSVNWTTVGGGGGVVTDFKIIYALLESLKFPKMQLLCETSEEEHKQNKHLFITTQTLYI